MPNPKYIIEGPVLSALVGYLKSNTEYQNVTSLLNALSQSVPYEEPKVTSPSNGESNETQPEKISA